MVLFYVFGVFTVCLYIFALWKHVEKKEKTGEQVKNDSEKKVTVEEEKKEGDPRYFLQKFLEEHQKQNVD